jgi:hypothetical protein
VRAEVRVHNGECIAMPSELVEVANWAADVYTKLSMIVASSAWP